jgi:uncharacterized membrane protein YeaQ/YmgE (transglycosylase-associated protein family)
MLFAAYVFHPATIAAWLAVGLAAGWLASILLESPSYGNIGDFALGCVGALIGGVLPAFFMEGDPELWVGLLTGLASACLFIGIARVVARLRSA